MAEVNIQKTTKMRKVRHRGRGSQVPIYLGKQLRFFVNQSDWKVLPMAAVIAALVSMVIRKDFFLTMEGNLKGAFALTCVGIWNGCFNSIQSICRERSIIKREHRSGMHISSYIVAHMIYQFALCAAQTGLSLYVMKMMGIHFPETGFVTPWMIVDLGISLLLIAYASDMMSLFISSISHTTTGAMTVMPFVLIFQLVFSGGMLTLPDWTKPLANFTISSYGTKAIAAQSGYNEAPMVTLWNTLVKMRNHEIDITVTQGQLLDMLNSEAVEKRSGVEVMKPFTVGEAADILNSADETLHLRDRELTLEPASESAEAITVTLGQVLDALHAGELAENMKDQQVLNEPVTLGQIAEFLKTNEALQAQRDREYTLSTSIGDLFDLLGEENVKSRIQEVTGTASYNADYEQSVVNVVLNWFMLFLFVLAFAALATISLEFIDKDKR